MMRYSKLNWIAVSAAILTSTTTASATEPYYTNLSEDALSCSIAKSIKASLSKEKATWAEKKKKHVQRLKSFSDFENAYSSTEGIQGLADGIFNARCGYLVQDAFIDPSAQIGLPKENWFGAYVYLVAVARSRLSDLKEPYNFVDDPGALKKTEKYLSLISASKSPYLEIPYTNEERKRLGLAEVTRVTYPGYTVTSKEVISVPVFHGGTDKEKEKAYAHFQEVNTVASPFFLWLAKQPKECVGQMEAFEKATEIYGDPFIALGVIAWITGYECALGSREKGALATSRLKPVLFRVSDHAGTNYHFWGYLVRGILGEPDGISYLRFRSRVFEGLIQRDGQDVTSDMLGLRVAEKVIKLLDSDSSSCNVENAVMPHATGAGVTQNKLKVMDPGAPMPAHPLPTEPSQAAPAK